MGSINLRGSKMAHGPDLLGREHEQVAKGPCECLVGAVAGLKCNRQYVRRAIGQTASGLCQPSPT